MGSAKRSFRKAPEPIPCLEFLRRDGCLAVPRLGDDDDAGWTWVWAWACGTEGCSSAVQVLAGALLGLLRRLPAFVESVLMHVDGAVPQLGLMGATLEDSISTRRSLERFSSQVLDDSTCRGHSTGCLAGETPPRPRPVNPPPTQSPHVRLSHPLQSTVFSASPSSVNPQPAATPSRENVSLYLSLIFPQARS